MKIKQEPGVGEGAAATPRKRQRQDQRRDDEPPPAPGKASVKREAPSSGGVLEQLQPQSHWEEPQPAARVKPEKLPLVKAEPPQPPVQHPPKPPKPVACAGCYETRSDDDDCFSAMPLRLGYATCCGCMQRSGTAPRARPAPAADLEGEVTVVFYHVKDTEEGGITQIGACGERREGLPPALRCFAQWSERAGGPGAVARAFVAWVERLHWHLRGEAAAPGRVLLVAHCGAKHAHELLAQALLDAGAALPAFRLADSCLAWKLAHGWGGGAGLRELQQQLLAPQERPIRQGVALDHARALEPVLQEGLEGWRELLWEGSVSLGRFTRLAGLQ